MTQTGCQPQLTTMTFLLMRSAPRPA